MKYLNKSAFTIIEILMVVIILGTLVAMAVPRLSGRTEQAKIAAAKADVTVNIPTALKLYELDNGFFPTSEQGLSALVRKPTTEPIPQNWSGPYLEKIISDPWGRAYQYQSPGTHRLHDYDLWSVGKSNKEDKTDDDIVNW